MFTPLAVRLLGDAGIGWHIRTGQQILQTHAVPRVDSFSSTMAGSPWFAWEWLFDVVVGELESLAGLNGVVLLAAVVIAAVFAGTFRLMLRRGTQVFVAVVLVLLAISASMIHFQARPHVMSWLFSLAWFWILDLSERASSLRPGGGGMLWALPPLMLLWVNVHGAWPVGFVLLAIYGISAAWTWLRAGNERFEDVLIQIRAARRVRELALVGVLAAVATLVNPYGWNLHAHIYHYLSNRFLMDHIEEFQSPNFHGVAQRCFAALLLIALVGLAAKARRVRLSEGLVVLFAVYSGLLASRNIPVSSMLLALVAGPLISEAAAQIKWRQFFRHRQVELRSAGPFGSAQGKQPRAAVPTFTTSTFSERMRSVELGLRGHLWPLAALALTGWIALHGGRFGLNALMDAHFDGKRFPMGAVDFVQQSTSTEPVLSPDYWGGYLVYRLYPRVLVVADDRHDLYGEDFFKSYLKTMHVGPGWNDFLLKHGVRRVLLPKSSQLANILAESPEWRIAYRDDVAVLFEK